ncbi:MAG: addiction module protein [Gemmatimonadetes bacterium]|nr:addiction module protein [Gemmatimonadota bacterium]
MLQKQHNRNTRKAWHPDQPYNTLPMLPVPAAVETHDVLKQCVRSRALLAELKIAASLIPNPAVLISTLPLLEAQASSEIENIVTTADNLFRHLEADDDADPATREALRYRAALLEGVQALTAKPLSTGTAEMICTRIKGVEMQVRVQSGTRIANSTTGQVIYTPPEGDDRLRTLLGNWGSFVHAVDGSESLDPLVRMAVAHYQFEAIHPFTDGNGRTGRVINSLFLVEQKLLAQPILYLSRYIIAHKSDYYRLLLEVTRDGAWEPWILYILRGIEETAAWTLDKIAAIRTLTTLTTDYLRTRYPKLYDRDLVDVIFEQPYCRIRNVVNRGLGTRQSASRYLHGMVSAGVLREVPFGREKLFLHSRLLTLLTQDGNDIAPFVTRRQA